MLFYPTFLPKQELSENSGSSTYILGSPDIHFQDGSLVNITCVVNSLKQPEHIFWYHNGEVISYYSNRGGISIVRQVGEEETITMSSLIIRQAGEEDQGTYTCRPLTGDFKTANTRLFIGQVGAPGARTSRALTWDLSDWLGGTIWHAVLVSCLFSYILELNIHCVL